MAFIDRIFYILGIRRIVLDKPLTLLGQDSNKVLNKISASRDFGWEEDLDREIRYTRKDEAFLEDIIRKVTSGKRRAYGKINYRHFGLHDPDD